jgi:CubicO group peptidase (beta-lactamase class C family)
MANHIDINGYCLEEFSQLREDFEQNFIEGHDIGASLCLNLAGENIVDLWGGHADGELSRAWEEDTIAVVYSTSKIPTIVCALMCIDRGLLDLDEPVAAYWPEFAQQGKDKITVREAMTHRARVPGFKDPIGALSLADWEFCVSRIAAEAPWFDDDRICYHAFSFGFILGELVRRVSGKPFRQFLNEELVTPLGMDFQMGLSEKAELKRVAEFLNVEDPPEEEGIGAQVFQSVNEPLSSEIWRTDWRVQSAVHPSGNGYTNARGLCRLATMLANGGQIDGKTYLSPEIIAEASREQVHDVDPMLGDIKLGLGFGLDGSEFPAPTPEAFHWGGYGGSWCFMDTSRKLAGAYVMNNSFVMDEWGGFTDPRMTRFMSSIRAIF